jgi:3',5'-cyclic AMP phosphodiesterase CpdA
MTCPVSIIQVSDTHLSRTHSYFVENWPIFVEEISARSPDLVVNTGDISFNGPDNEDDLAFAARLHNQLPAPWAAIAGNHDVGETPLASRNKQVVNSERLGAWRRHVGPSWWVRDLPGLRAIGLDTALMGSGHIEEQGQVDFFEAALADRGSLRPLVFVHFPPFGHHVDEEASIGSLLPEPRRWFLARCAEAGVLAIACGHLHGYQQLSHASIPVVIAPATSFVTIPARAPADWHRPRCGFIAWTWDGTNLTHELVEPPRFITRDMSAWIETHGTTIRLPELL